MNWFLNIISNTYSLLGIVHFPHTVRYVTVLFLAMSVGIVLFFLFTLITLIIHQISDYYYRLSHRRYTLWIIKYLVDHETTKPQPNLISRQAFEGAILDLLLITKGTEKSVLFKLYKKTGFWEGNLIRLKSRYWHRRLEALVKMDIWQFSLGTERIQHLLEDENIQIRQIALKNLSRTKEPYEAEIALKTLIREHFFYSVQYETIYRLIRVHRELVLKCLEKPEFQRIHPLIIKVLGDSRIIEGVPELLKAAQETDLPHMRENALISLGKIGDPRGLEVLKKGLESSSPKERLASLQSIHLIDPKALDDETFHLKDDPDSTVRSWYDHYQRGGQ